MLDIVKEVTGLDFNEINTDELARQAVKDMDLEVSSMTHGEES